jgi:hypothetical protein
MKFAISDWLLATNPLISAIPESMHYNYPNFYRMNVRIGSKLTLCSILMIKNRPLRYLPAPVLAVSTHQATLLESAPLQQLYIPFRTIPTYIEPEMALPMSGVHQIYPNFVQDCSRVEREPVATVIQPETVTGTE